MFASPVWTYGSKLLQELNIWLPRHKSFLSWDNFLDFFYRTFFCVFCVSSASCPLPCSLCFLVSLVDLIFILFSILFLFLSLFFLQSFFLLFSYFSSSTSSSSSSSACFAASSSFSIIKVRKNSEYFAPNRRLRSRLAPTTLKRFLALDGSDRTSGLAPSISVLSYSFPTTENIQRHCGRP